MQAIRALACIRVEFDKHAVSLTRLSIQSFDDAKTIQLLIDALNIAPGAGKMGYRMVANAGDSGMQEVPHLHVHIVSGRPLGRMIPRAD